MDIDTLTQENDFFSVKQDNDTKYPRNLDKCTVSHNFCLDF